MFFEHIWSTYSIFSWSDIGEIVLITYGIYAFAQWLSHDTQKNLLPHFYMYTLATIGTYYASMPTLTIVLCALFPVIMVIFLLVHQQTLQKNFIALRSLSTTPTTNPWLPELVRAMLNALNRGTQIFMVFENTDSIASFVTCSLPINAPVQHHLLDALLASPAYNHHTMLWLTAQGTCIGINTSWTYKLEHEWIDENIQKLESWQQHALFISAKTDALFFHMDPVTRRCCLIMRGTLYEKMQLNAALNMICSHLHIAPIAQENGDFYVHTKPISSYSQRSS